MVLPLRITIARRPIEIVLDVAEDLTMDSYPGPLSQVLGSLFDNCLLHAFAGNAQGVIRIGASVRTSEVLAISVADNGVGIAPELTGRVYDPFFTTRLGSGGSGLGLHVTHNIVTGVLGGRMELESQLGAGTVFTLVLPVVAPGFVTLA